MYGYQGWTISQILVSENLFQITQICAITFETSRKLENNTDTY